MPGFIEAFEQAASEMYPSRQLPQEPSGPLDAQPIPKGPAKPTDADVFQVVSSSYNKIVSAFDSLGDIIDDYNYGYIASDIAVRREKSAVHTLPAISSTPSLPISMCLDLPEDCSYTQESSRFASLRRGCAHASTSIAPRGMFPCPTPVRPSRPPSI